MFQELFSQLAKAKLPVLVEVIERAGIRNLFFYRDNITNSPQKARMSANDGFILLTLVGEFRTRRQLLATKTKLAATSSVNEGSAWKIAD